MTELPRRQDSLHFLAIPSLDTPGPPINSPDPSLHRLNPPAPAVPARAPSLLTPGPKRARVSIMNGDFDISHLSSAECILLAEQLWEQARSRPDAVPVTPAQ